MKEALNGLIGELRSATRYRWPGLLAAWGICLAGWFVVMLMPNIYESHARVFADTRTALRPVIEGIAIQQDVAAQLNLVTESLMGDAQLTRIVNEVGLVNGEPSPAALASALDELRKNVHISVDASLDRNRAGGSIYWISYRDPDRQRSLQVVNMLLEFFMDQTMSGKLENSEAAQRFLLDQIRENEARLREAEQRLADFKKDNVGTMPGAEGDYFTRLQAEIDANRKARAALSIALNRRDELNRQLKEGASMAASGGMLVRPVSPDGRAVSAGDTAGRLMEARAKLSDLLQQYTEKHPAVSTLREEIADLEQRRARELEALRAGDPEAVAATGANTDPVYQSIQLALNQVGVEIASLRGEISQHEQKIAELQQLVKIVPEVEAEFARLNRDYDVTKTQYLALLERLEKARLGQDAEATGSGIKLQVLNPPTASAKPVAPKRPLLILSVFLAGLGAGGALSYLLAKINPVFDNTRELEALTGRPVLGVVSMMTLDQYRATVRWNYLRFAALATGLVVVFMVMLVVSRVAPNLAAIA